MYSRVQESGRTEASDPLDQAVVSRMGLGTGLGSSVRAVHLN